MYARNAFFEIARWVAAFAILLSLGTLFGSNKISDADPAEVEAAVIAQLDMTSMLKADNQMVKRLYGLDPASFESCILYYPTTNMMAEELLIVKLKDNTTDSFAQDDNYKTTDYTDDSGRIVLVTYAKGDDVVHFVLNYNTYTVKVRLEGINGNEAFEVPAYGFRRINGTVLAD